MGLPVLKRAAESLASFEVSSAPSPELMAAFAQIQELNIASKTPIPELRSTAGLFCLGVKPRGSRCSGGGGASSVSVRFRKREESTTGHQASAVMCA
uniref:Uncharacterized protein n=1 Tax=Knipowitschia caucasica TaxID=637954 RepID=A0AAV2KA09_KNICA